MSEPTETTSIGRTRLHASCRECGSWVEHPYPNHQSACCDARLAPVEISVAPVDTLISVALDDSGCVVGAVRRVVIGTESAEFRATERDENGRLVWKRTETP